MSSPPTSGPPPAFPHHPKPTSGRENNRVAFWFAGVAIVVLALVLGFNFLGPKGASRSGGSDGPAPSSMGTAASEKSTTRPQAADSTTPPGRESQGAPRGSSPSPAAQGQAAGSPAQAVPPAATAPASATPTAPPASR